MKWKGFPFYFDIKFFFQSINTPGNEIAPGSDIIRENGQFFMFVSHTDFLDGLITII